MEFISTPKVTTFRIGRRTDRNRMRNAARRCWCGANRDSRDQFAVGRASQPGVCLNYFRSGGAWPLRAGIRRPSVLRK
jgi:hypothetical protein